MNKSDYIFFDTNTLIRLFEGDELVREILGNKSICISVITEMEIQCKSNITSIERNLIRDFLEECTIFGLNEQIKKLAIKTRLSTSLKLMDSIIVASAQWIDLPLLTGDNKFKSASMVDVILLPSR